MSNSYPAKFSELESAWNNLMLTNSSAYAHWDADRRRVLLNEGVFEVFLELIDVFEEEHFVEVSENIAIADGGSFDLQSLPNYYRLLLWEKLLGQTWVPVRIFSAGESWRAVAAGDVEPWYQIGKKLKPALTTSGTYRATYFRIPQEMTQAGSDVDLPTEYRMLAAYHAAMSAAMQERQRQDYEVFKERYAFGVAKMKRTAAKRNLAKTWRVADTEGYGHDSLNPPIFFTE